jgi:uncharacterized protein YndB with AHSA1/START domain
MPHDRIEKSIELTAPVSTVWQALTDYRQFGEWFHVKVESPFVPGQKARGHMTYPDYEHIVWEVMIEKMVPETLFSFTWHPYAIDPKKDYSNETPTLVDFKLQKTTQGTLLSLCESGFSMIPLERQAEALRMNEHGWEVQLSNIEKYVS